MLCLSFHTQTFMKGIPMNKNFQQTAMTMLEKVLETQPGVMEKKSSSMKGGEAAQFCIDFIDTFSDWLESNDKSAG